MKREAEFIKLAAAISAAPRWVTALMIPDRAKFAWSNETWWMVASAVTALVFAVVETYAASYMMRSWRSAKGSAETTLGVLWITTLVVLTAVMAPPIYANTMDVAFNTLPQPIVTIWTLCVASSTFLVIGGVGYADKLPKAAEPRAYVGPAQAKLATVEEKPVAKAPVIPAEGSNAWKVLDYMARNPIAGPTEVSRSLEMNLNTVKSIQRQMRLGEIALGSNHNAHAGGDAPVGGIGPDTPHSQLN